MVHTWAPGVALGRGVMDHAQLAYRYRVDGMGIEIEIGVDTINREVY